MNASSSLSAGFLCRMLLWPLLALSAFATAQPANDNIASAEAIATLPFVDAESAIHLATTEPADPIVPCRVPRTQAAQSVWYRYTTGASVEYVSLTTATSDYDTMIAIHAGSPADLQAIAGGCNDRGVAGSATLARLDGVRLAAATTYHIEVVQKTSNATPRTLNFQMSAAPQYLVNKLLDSADGSCTAGDCSLREAILASNAVPGAVIVPTGTYLLSILGPSEQNGLTGDVDIRAGMGIYGAGRGATIIDGDDIDRVLEVVPTGGMTVQLADLSIVNGMGGGFTTGAGLNANGADTVLYLQRASFRNHVTSTQGGAVWTAAQTFVESCDFRTNTSSAFGGGIYFSSSLPSEIINSLFALNTGGNGGGIASAGELTIVNTTVTTNTAFANGGGVHFHGTGQLRVFSTTIADNTSGNTTGGGGIFKEGASALPQIFNSVIAGNTAVSNGFDCSFDAASGTYNHVSTSGCFFGGTGNVFNTPLVLLPLTNFGGVADIRGFDTGSPLLDTANPSGCSDGNARALVNDQRGAGFPRAQDGDSNGTVRCDKGAFERTPPPPLIFANGFE